MQTYAVVGGAEELLLVDGRVPHHAKRHGALLEAVLALDHNLVLAARAQVVLVLFAHTYSVRTYTITYSYTYT